MSQSFHMELVSPEKVVFSGEIHRLIVPLLEGEETIMAHHAPMIGQLKIGFVSLHSDVVKNFFILGGFVHVKKDQAIILGEKVVPREEMRFEILDDFIAQAKLSFERLSNVTDEERNAQEQRLYQLKNFRDYGFRL